MDEINFIRVPTSYLEQVESWFGGDASERLLELPGGDSSVGEADEHGWVAMFGQEPVGFAVLRFNKERVGHLSFEVKPSERRQGIGGQLMQFVLSQPEVQRITRLHVLIGMDNVAAQKILGRSRFSQIGHTADGRQIYERH